MFVKQIKLVSKVDRRRHIFLCIFHEPYIIPDLVSTGFRCLGVSWDILLESASFLQILLMRFSWLVTKFKKLSSFTAVFWNLLWSLKKLSILSIYLPTLTIELHLLNLWDLLEHPVLLMINVQAYFCYKCKKKTVLYP